MGIRKEKRNLITKATSMMILSGSLLITANNQEAYADTASSQSYIKSTIQKGTVYNCGSLNVRKGPGTSNSIITKVYSGNTVEIQEKNSNGWYKIKTPNGQVGWVSGAYIRLASNNNQGSSVASSQPTQAINKNGVVYNCDSLNVRTGPGASNSIITKVYSGNSVYIQEKHSNGWYKVKTSNGQVGWVSGSYVKIQEASSNQNNQNNNQNNQVTNNNKSKKIVDLAHKQLGKPYVWGAEGPSSFDCSGLTSYVYKNAAGVKLPRTSKSQGTVGRYVSKANLKPGDLVFFASNGKTINHVGIYIGNSKMIHSPKPGQNVRIDSISSGYYAKNYFTARAVL
ncbi:C40 family peptidase [Romboutsia sp. 1001713B170131_170501_G6]|uniref:C40 family peptidase n=1 Tax=Romboutsia sp. 1001713B170131_170501_G6 TaxID=2787108 RepID=UPI0018AACD4F|nr:C40 family peptidase [Romboutsia sp. 1001713B170131_170501_G6]